MAFEPGRRDRQAGVGLISVMIGIVLVSIAALALSSLVVNNKTAEVSINRWGKGEQVMVNAAAALQALPYSILAQFCQSKNAYNNTRSGICAPGGQLSKSADVQPGTDPVLGGPKVVEVLRDWSGDAASGGQVCVELTSCMEVAGGYMLEVTLKGYWLDANPNIGTSLNNPKVLAFRRTR